MFEVPFPLQRRADIFVEFVVDEPFQAMALGEAINQALTMLPNASRQVPG